MLRWGVAIGSVCLTSTLTSTDPVSLKIAVLNLCEKCAQYPSPPLLIKKNCLGLYNFSFKGKITISFDLEKSKPKYKINKKDKRKDKIKKKRLDYRNNNVPRMLVLDKGAKT